MGFRTTLGIADRELYEGDDDTRRRAREELRRQQRLHFAESSTWKRLNLADLRFERFYVEHAPSGERYRIVRGEVMDAHFTPAVAWFVGTDGGPVFLEPAR